MRGRFCCAALALSLVPAVSFAQDGLRSASLPERSLTSSQPPPEDGYRARPGTYRPDLRPRRLRLPPLYGFYEPQLIYPTAQPIILVVPREPSQEARMPDPAPVPLAPYVAGTPGPAKMFYVIPGCYLGDRRPDPESLAAGCSLSRLRVVPPRP